MNWNSGDKLISFVVYSHSDWRKNYVRFETEIARHKYKIFDCEVTGSEIMITLLANATVDDLYVTEIARRWFGPSYAGRI